MNKLAAVLAGVWLGLQLGIGYVAVPVLFQHMGKMEAGAMAGAPSFVQEAKSALNPSGVSLPRPTAAKAPTMFRTIW